jgi:hypothetical protein
MHGRGGEIEREVIDPGSIEEFDMVSSGFPEGAGSMSEIVGKMSFVSRAIWIENGSVTMFVSI